MESKITYAIIKEATEDWLKITECDVVIAGAGPSGMTAAKYLADEGFNVVIFERRLCFGGGIGGGGMLFHKIVVEEPANEILEEFGVKMKKVEDLYVVDAAEMMAKLASGCIDAGAKIIHGVSIEDVIFRENPLRIIGVLIQWSAVELAGLHVDPIFVKSKAVIDATGHDAEVVRVASKKIPELKIEVKGESSAHCEVAEKLVVEKTGKIVDGLYVTGMSVASVYRLPRMGPIFGGMLLSGKKVAEIVKRDLKG